jgi:hypothetical protein
MVITLGTPFSRGQRDNNAWKLYEAINDHDVDHPPVPIAPEEKPPMRTVAIWLPRDGILGSSECERAAKRSRRRSKCIARTTSL